MELSKVSGGGEDIKSVRICERAANEQETEKKKLILVQFSHKVIAYDCRWSVAPCGRVEFTEPRKIFWRTAAPEDEGVVFKKGKHYWQSPGASFPTVVINEPAVQPMAEEDDWVKEVGTDWAGVWVKLPADWPMVDEWGSSEGDAMETE